MNSTHNQTSKEARAAHIRAFVLSVVEDVPKNLALHVCRALYIPVTDVHKEIQCMVNEGFLISEGRTSSRRYKITEHGKACRDGVSRTSLASGQTRHDDAELLGREPRTMQEAERKTWLLRRSAGPRTKTPGRR